MAGSPSCARPRRRSWPRCRPPPARSSRVHGDHRRQGARHHDVAGRRGALRRRPVRLGVGQRDAAQDRRAQPHDGCRAALGLAPERRDVRPDRLERPGLRGRTVAPAGTSTASTWPPATCSGPACPTATSTASPSRTACSTSVGTSRRTTGCRPRTSRRSRRRLAACCPGPSTSTASSACGSVSRGQRPPVRRWRLHQINGKPVQHYMRFSEAVDTQPPTVPGKPTATCGLAGQRGRHLGRVHRQHGAGRHLPGLPRRRVDAGRPR